MASQQQSRSGDASVALPVAPRASVIRALGSALLRFANEDGFVIAGNLAFTGLFALFPFMIFLLSLAGFVGETDAAKESIAIALAIAPEEVRSTLLPAIDQIRNGTTPGLLTIGIVVAVWAASSGIEAARHALDRAYGTDGGERHFALARLQSIGLTVVAAVLILVAVLVIVAGPLVSDLVEWVAQRKIYDHSLTNVVRYAIGLTLFLGLVTMFHRVLPVANLSFREILPGSILTVVVWALVATTYSLYLQHLGGYNLTYGSLGGIALTLFFFYISAAIFIFGAQLNGALRRQRERIRRHLRTVGAQAAPAPGTPA